MCMTLTFTVASVKRNTRIASRTAGTVEHTMASRSIAPFLFQIPPLSQIQTILCITAERATKPTKKEPSTGSTCAEYTRWCWSQYAILLISIGPKALCVDSAMRHLSKAKCTAHICKQIIRASWRRDEMDNLKNVVVGAIINKKS